MPYKDPEVRKAYLRDYQARWYADPVNRAKHIRAVMKNSAATAEIFAERVRQFKSKPLHALRTDLRSGMHGFCDVVCSNCHRLRTKQRRVSSLDSFYGIDPA
jgi:hypothetical protein